ncbi:MAG TPA: NAD(P)/FAD-dependent oxidoreductase [Phycisphaerae bacterium]|nr:NAD(P)/FAD-dependent oxidoreductase [Phycisphaerae bacterium]
MSRPVRRKQVVIIGGGFSGLTAGYELAKAGIGATVLEKEPELGGLAASFEIAGVPIEKFYHHWFTGDTHVLRLIDELGMGSKLRVHKTRTGLYCRGRSFRLSTPMDLLRFSPLRLRDRIRLGLLTLRARRVRDWRQLEEQTAEQWLIDMAGRGVYDVLWEPLLRGKFGRWAPEISAVWIWNKLVLRGSSRTKGGAEALAYLEGGFSALADALAGSIAARGGTVRTDCAVDGLLVAGGRVVGVRVGQEELAADAVIATPSLPVVADLVAPHVHGDYSDRLRRVSYLANVCLVLELSESLSEYYWLNVADAEFPYVGVIEHTNFEPPQVYGGRHIVYLSKYLPPDEPLFRMADAEVLGFSIPHIERLFPQFAASWIQGYHVFRALHSQPVVVRRYGSLAPAAQTPLGGLYLCTMAQVYPEDRGTNYAVRNAAELAGKMVASLRG